MYHEVVFEMRNMAQAILPLLVVVWATFAVLGGAVYLAKHTGPEQATAGTGIGLCAVTVAVLFKKGVGRVRPPRATVPLPGVPVRSFRVSLNPPVDFTPASSSLTRLLQVFRT